MIKAKKVVDVIIVVNDGNDKNTEFLKNHKFLGLENNSPVLKHNSGIMIGRNDIIIFNEEDFSINQIIKPHEDAEGILEQYYIFEDNHEEDDDENNTNNINCSNIDFNNIDTIIDLVNKSIDASNNPKDIIEVIRKELNKKNKEIK